MNLRINPKIKAGFWFISAILIGIFLGSLVSLFFTNINYAKIFQPEQGLTTVLQSLAKEEIRTEEKLKYFYLNKDTNGELKVSASAYLVGDLNTGEVILSKNQEKQLPIASISKLMTALTANEIANKDDVTQVTKKALATYGTNGNLRSGEKIKIEDLLYPLLLESSNDAAEVLAEHFGRDVFIRKMNEIAQNLKMSSTFYEDPSGLSPENKSTAADIFKLAGYLNQQKQEQAPNLLQITALRSYSDKKHNWSNISRFLHKDGYIGGKSGYTDKAKQTVVSLFSLPLGESGYRPIAITLLGSQDRYRDVENILKYLKKNIYYGGKADANTNWVAEKIRIPYIKDPDFVTLAFVGDIMLDRGVRNSVTKNFQGDYSSLFENMAILKKSDIVFANLEGTASDQGADQKNLYSFRMDPPVLPSL